MCSVLFDFLFLKVSLNASFKLHKDVFRKLVYSPMRFFDVTPSGQILNRFSKDMDEGKRFRFNYSTFHFS